MNSPLVNNWYENFLKFLILFWIFLNFSSPESRREKNTTNHLATVQHQNHLATVQQQNTSWFRKPKNSEQCGNPAAVSNVTFSGKPQNGDTNLIPSTSNQVKSQC